MELFSAIVKLGLPVAAFSWFMFSWLYREGKLDKQVGRKEIDKEIKQMKKTAKESGESSDNFIYKKWLWFGGGFYGVAALWTLIVVEIRDFINFMLGMPGSLDMFQNGIGSAIGAIILNQLQNLLSAFIWFTYWNEGTIWLWFLIAYLGYLLGIEAAKRYQGQPWQQLKRR